MLIPPGSSHLGLAWEVPAFARVFERLASFTRLIRLDHRGTGLSDPLAHAESLSVEALEAPSDGLRRLTCQLDATM